MFVINVDSDITKASADVNGFFRSQIPFATSKALNRTMLGVQSQWRVWIPQSWTARNQALSKALTTIPRGHFATKRKLEVSMVSARSRISGYLAGEGFFERQQTGQMKTAKGRYIAIPIEGRGLRRSKGGTIPKAKKPKNRDDLFKIKSKGGRVILAQRVGKKKIVRRFVLTPTAKGTDPLARLYPQTHAYVDRFFLVMWRQEMKKAIKSSRFYEG